MKTIAVKKQVIPLWLIFVIVFSILIAFFSGYFTGSIINGQNPVSNGSPSPLYQTPSPSPSPSVTLTALPSANETVNAIGLIGYWKFDEGEGNIARDSSAFLNNGFIQGNPNWVVGKHGNAIYLDGINNYVEIINSDDLSLSGIHPFTLEAWIKPDISQGQSGSLAANIIDKFSNYGLVFDHPNTDARGIIFRSEGNWFFSGEVVISSGAWHHYVGVYDPPYLRAYLDGVEVSVRNVGNLRLDTNSNSVVFGTNMELTSRYKGAIDEIMIYARALTAQEVWTQYTTP
jgi:hypothetical protein